MSRLWAVGRIGSAQAWSGLERSEGFPHSARAAGCWGLAAVTVLATVTSVSADSSSGSGSTPSKPDAESTPTLSSSVSGAPAEAAAVAVPANSGAAVGEAATQGAGRSERTALNLLGKVDSSSGESRRNENVQITLVDNNVLKELNIRMGTTATLVPGFDADKGYFGAEFGGAPAGQIHLPAAKGSGFHGNIYESYNNSLFSARSFFQVGGVKPSRSNDYGFRVGTPVWRGGHLTVDASQQKIRGQCQRKCPRSCCRRANAARHGPATEGVCV